MSRFPLLLNVAGVHLAAGVLAGAVGVFAGAFAGGAGAFAGALAGAAGALAGATGALVGALTGALAGALTGAAGAFAGALAGAFLRKPRRSSSALSASPLDPINCRNILNKFMKCKREHGNVL